MIPIKLVGAVAKPAARPNTAAAIDIDMASRICDLTGSMMAQGRIRLFSDAPSTSPGNGATTSAVVLAVFI